MTESGSSTASPPGAGCVWPRVRGACPACGIEAELKRLDDRHVFCTICETTSMAASGDFEPL